MPTSPRRRSSPLSPVLLAAVLATPGCGTGASGAPGLAPADAPALSDPPALRVMTFNIRYGTAPDGDDAWPVRRGLLVRTIETYAPALLGVQEALRFQLDEVEATLTGMGELGVGRDDGVEAGEYSALLYDRTRLAPLDHGTFWLSDTPHVPGSMTWGNRFPRVVTWALFRDSATGASFYALNTHWDHESQNARERSAAGIVDWIDRHAGSRPVVLMGDFNAGEANPAFRALLEAGDRSVRLRDSFRSTHPEATDVGTYHAFTGDATGEKIDAILVSPEWTVVDAAIVRDSADGRWPSDHFPVRATLRWSGPPR